MNEWVNEWTNGWINEVGLLSAVQSADWMPSDD